MKKIEVTKSEASLLWFSIAVATTQAKVTLVGPERQRNAMAALKPLRVLLADDPPNKYEGGQWRFRYDDDGQYTITYDDAAFAMMREYWGSEALNRGIFLMDEDSSEHLLAVDELLKNAADVAADVAPKAAPKVKVNGKTKPLEAVS
jgi:hypothetical protein